jgi:hypothetical protein
MGAIGKVPTEEHLRGESNARRAKHVIRRVSSPAIWRHLVSETSREHRSLMTSAKTGDLVYEFE